MTQTIGRRAALVTLLAAGAAGAAQAQSFPTRPIRIISPFAPGGFNDVLSRLIGGRISDRLGQPVVVDNRPGANTIIGSEMVAKSPPDGYTMLMSALPHVVNPSLYNLPYDPVRDFTPIGLITTVPNVLVVHPSLPVHSVAELIAYAKARPGELAFGSVGTGSSYHMAGELFKTMAGVDMLHVPYRGSAPAMTDLLAGRFSVFFANMVSVIPLIREGKLRALGVTQLSRAAIMPELPTVAESGLPGFAASSWYGLLGPANLPAPILATLNGAINAITAMPDFRERLLRDGAEPLSGTPQDFAKVISDGIALWADVVRQRGIRVE
jgi:tripartite-type tricarboxylate transporter receptor subunit TctC